MNIMQRAIRLSVAVGLGLAGFIATVPAYADAPVPRYMDLVDIRVDVTAGPVYSHEYTIVFSCDDSFGGSGVFPASGYSDQGLGTIVQTIAGSLNGSTLLFHAIYISPPAWAGNFYDFTGTVDLNGNAVGQSIVNGLNGPYDTTLTVTGASGPNHGQWVTAQTTKAAKQAMAKSCNGKPIFGDDDDD